MEDWFKLDVALWERAWPTLPKPWEKEWVEIDRLYWMRKAQHHFYLMQQHHFDYAYPLPGRTFFMERWGLSERRTRTLVENLWKTCGQLVDNLRKEEEAKQKKDGKNNK